MTTPQHSSQIWMRLCVLPLLLPICVALLACAAMFSSPRNRNGTDAPKVPMPGGTSKHHRQGKDEPWPERLGPPYRR
jgi:hypothetical protein